MDVKKKELNSLYCFLFLVVGILYCMISRCENIEGAIISVIPGMMLFLCGILIKEHIGIGDGVMVITMGLFVAGEIIMTILFWGFSFLTMVAVVITLHKRRERIMIPIAPFLLAGEVCTFILYNR